MQEQRAIQEDAERERRKNEIEEDCARRAQEIDISIAKKERLERTVEVLQQENKAVQDRIDAASQRASQDEAERKALKVKVHAMEADLRRDEDEEQHGLSATWPTDVAAVEARALQAQHAELRSVVERLRQERAEAEARCREWEASIEKLEERQRCLPVGRSRKRSTSRTSRGSKASMRFMSSLKGLNCTMTGDGITATRTKGCRQCVVIGDQPLELVAGVGWYFELRVNEVVAGWVGGLGFGVTITSPSTLTSLPERAWRIPDTWMAGYWGRMFANGEQHLI